jgi:pimeloyl-ACP methyl ester carboxylesterase
MPKLAPLLAQHFTVFMYDRRGRNDSGDTAPYAVEREIEDIQALIGEAGGSAFVLGISSGGALALTAAANGLSIRKLVMYEPPFTVEDTGHPPPSDYEAQLDRLLAAGRRGDAVKYFLKMVGVPAVVVVLMRFLPVWAKLKAVAHTLPYDDAVMGDSSVPTRRAASVRMPTLVISGEKSPPSLRHAAQRLASVLPNATHRTLEGQTHDVSAKALAPVLHEFFTA